MRIRTPLNAIIGFTHILQNKNHYNAEQKKNKLQKIESAAKHLLSVINDILDFSKIEAHKLELEQADFKIENIFIEVFNFIEAFAQQKGIEVVFDLDYDIPATLKGDQLRLSQVLLNFANNAVKFTESGVIKFKANLININNSDIHVRFEVIDTGIGLTENQTSNLFKAFEQADDSTTRRFGGTGLGLAISKQIVHLMGGEIGVNSNYGQGSTFWFTAKFLHTDNPTTMKSTQPLSHQRILIVDDSEEVRRIHGSILEHLKLRYSTAANGKAAIDASKEALSNDDPFTIILMDWDMPGLNGLETTKEIRDLPGLSKSVHILISAYNNIIEEKCHDKNCFDATLTKPVSPSLMLDTLLDVTFNEASSSNISLSSKNIKTSSIPNWSEANYQVLVVEDNLVNQEVLSDLLQDVGLNITLAGNGEIAIQKIKEKVPDIVFMDIQMPVMDGYEATRQLRKTYALNDLPIIAMTANAFTKDKEKCEEAGMNYHLAKPVEPNILYSTLRLFLPDLTTTRVVDNEDNDNELLNILNKIPGLDTQTGLKYMSGNIHNYIRTLSRYKDNQANDIKNLHYHLSNDETSDAIRIAHTLKGTSATLGIHDVNLSADKLEHALAINEGDIKALTLELEQHQLRIIVALNKYLPDMPKVKKDKITQNKEDILHSLTDLQDLLTKSDYNSSKSLELILPAITKLFENEALSLEQHVSNYNYNEALNITKSMINEMDT